MPALPKPPAVDGALKDLAGALALEASGEARSATFSARVAFRRDTLFLGVELQDDKLLDQDGLEVSLHFPEAGTTARGYAYVFGAEGLRAPDEVNGPPAFANALVKATVRVRDEGATFEAAFPPRSLPRFPAHAPLVFELCVTYLDRDSAADRGAKLSTCEGGSTRGGPLRLPDELRRGLKLSPPKKVVGVEARQDAWIGYASLHYPHWVLADAPLTPESLRALVSESPIDPASVHIPIPANMALPDGRPIYAVLSGKDPYAVEGQCEHDHELRMALYVVHGREAERALEWPAATCALGRARSFVLNDEGGLSIGYTNGSTSTFTWSTDHFERTELGRR